MLADIEGIPNYLSEYLSFLNRPFLINEKKIEAFKERMENAGPERKAKYGRRVADLEQKNRDLRRNLAEYRDEGRSRWEQFKSNFKRDMDGIGETMNDLFKSND